MIVSVTVCGEDEFDSSIECKSSYDDSACLRENIFVVDSEDGKINVIHMSGDMRVNENCAVESTYLKEDIKTCVRIFKAMYPDWKEYDT